MLSLVRRRDPWWDSDGPAARAERRRRRAVSSLAFATSIAAVLATAGAWSIQLGLASLIGVHAHLLH